MKLRKHTVRLQDGKLVLRPTTEQDWDLLLRWNSDPEVLYYAEGDDVSAYTLEQVQGIYRETSQSAYCFIMEWEGQPIGECWLQKMNLERILQKYPDQDCRRIDLMIGDKTFWGQGIGTKVIRRLTQFAFEQERADLVFGCEIGDYNPRSQKAFQKVGFRLDGVVPQPPGRKAQVGYDLVCARRPSPEGEDQHAFPGNQRSPTA